jgi:cobalt-zinc-cadmium efflux system outer membrane protein
LEQALDLVTRNNPTLQANQTLILQNKAQEITANLRPNPVLSWDTQYLPVFEPSLFTDSNYWQTQAQYDVGISYLFERGKKRRHRLDAAKTATAVTEAQVADAQRTVLANAAQLYVSALLAKANLELAENLLDGYRRTVKVSQDRFNAGALSKNDLLKIQLQTLQFETEVNTDRLAKVQALAALRQFLGFDSVPADYDVAGSLVYEPVPLRLEDVQARALADRPDLLAAQRSVTASESQVGLAKANGKVDLDATFNYTRFNQNNLGAFYFNRLPVFNKNQGEIARTQYALTQSQFQQKAAEQQVLTDVKNAYENLRTSEQVVQLYDKGSLQQASQSLEITHFSYEHGAASLLDFLDAERNYRSTELGYRQALATYMTALEQLRLAVGTRDLQ